MRPIGDMKAQQYAVISKILTAPLLSNFVTDKLVAGEKG